MSMPRLDELREAAKSIVDQSIQEGTLGTLTVLAVLAKLEELYDLEAGSLKDKQYRKPLKKVIIAAAEQRKATSRSGTKGSLSREDEDMEEEDASEPATTSSKKRRRPESKKQYKSAEVVDSSGMEDEGHMEPGPSERRQKLPAKGKVEDNVHDESKKLEKRRKVESQCEDAETETKSSSKKNPEKKKAEKDGTKTTQKRTSGKKNPKEELSQDEATIKRLKSFVLACGVRKVWSKVFKDCDEPSQQIKKLKDMLRELGMTGRYSLEKAKQIKEKRELAQELEDVKSFEQTVLRRGRKTKSSEEEDEDSESEDDVKPAKRKQTARQSITAFLGDQSDDE